MDCVPYDDVTYQYYYDDRTKKEDEEKKKNADRKWRSFKYPLCSHSPFESHNSLEWRLNRTKRSPHP